MSSLYFFDLPQVEINTQECLKIGNINTTEHQTTLVNPKVLLAYRLILKEGVKTRDESVKDILISRLIAETGAFRDFILRTLGLETLRTAKFIQSITTFHEAFKTSDQQEVERLDWWGSVLGIPSEPIVETDTLQVFSPVECLLSPEELSFQRKRSIAIYPIDQQIAPIVQATHFYPVNTNNGASSVASSLLS